MIFSEFLNFLKDYGGVIGMIPGVLATFLVLWWHPRLVFIRHRKHVLKACARDLNYFVRCRKAYERASELVAGKAETVNDEIQWLQSVISPISAGADSSLSFAGIPRELAKDISDAYARNKALISKSFLQGVSIRRIVQDDMKRSDGVIEIVSSLCASRRIDPEEISEKPARLYIDDRDGGWIELSAYCPDKKTGGIVALDAAVSYRTRLISIDLGEGGKGNLRSTTIEASPYTVKTEIEKASFLTKEIVRDTIKDVRRFNGDLTRLVSTEIEQDKRDGKMRIRLYLEKTDYATALGEHNIGFLENKLRDPVLINKLKNDYDNRSSEQKSVRGKHPVDAETERLLARIKDIKQKIVARKHDDLVQRIPQNKIAEDSLPVQICGLSGVCVEQLSFSVIVMSRDGYLILLKRANNVDMHSSKLMPSGNGNLQFEASSVGANDRDQYGTPDIYQTMQRELKEELGLNVPVCSFTVLGVARMCTQSEIGTQVLVAMASVSQSAEEIENNFKQKVFSVDGWETGGELLKLRAELGKEYETKKKRKQAEKQERKKILKTLYASKYEKCLIAPHARAALLYAFLHCGKVKLSDFQE